MFLNHGTRREKRNKMSLSHNSDSRAGTTESTESTERDRGASVFRLLLLVHVRGVFGFCPLDAFDVWVAGEDLVAEGVGRKNRSSVGSAKLRYLAAAFEWPFLFWGLIRFSSLALRPC